MSPRPQFDRDDIEAELTRISDHLQKEVDAYLIGGGAMALRDLKDTTKDIDLVVVTDEAFSRLMGTLRDLGYTEVTDIGDEYDKLGARHCVRNDEGYQLDVFNRQIADKLIFSEGMEARSEEFLTTQYLSIGLVSLEDTFLFKAVAERPDDIEDMATLVPTELDYATIEEEIAAQVDLLGGERFITIISESLEKLDNQEGIQTPLDTAVQEYYERYMKGYELRLQLDEETPIPVSELAEKLELPESEVERRFKYLEQYGDAERTTEGIRDTGRRDEFKRS